MERRVSIVQYDLTSSEDERDPSQSYILSSSKLASSCAAVIDCESSEGDPNEKASVVELTSSSQESSEEEIVPAAKRSRVVHQLSSSESSSSSEQEMPGTVAVCSSSEDESVEQPASPSKKTYALPMGELPPQLKEFLMEAHSFFTRPHSLERLGQNVAISTYGKAQERIMCFLGHVRRRFPNKTLTPELFNHVHFIESYLDHLKEQRGLTSATISNHASSLLYPLKYYHRSHAPNFSAVPIIAQLRRTATILQRQGDVERPKTREDLKALNKWLDWDEVLEATSLQRSRFEVARGKRQRAREAADLLLLSLYCHIPPSRGLEMRTLEIVHETDLGEPFAANRFRNRNIALLQNPGGVAVHVQLFKTRRFTGHDTIPIQADSELCRLFKQYVNDFRCELCAGQSNEYLFVNSNGLPYSSAAFSRHIKNLMVRLTGREVSVNALRSSFLTWAYSQSDCNDTLKDSLAAALRHSREQAQSTYDRRTANEKKSAALDLARRKAEEGPDQEALAASRPSEPEIAVGQFVGLVGEESTLQEPSILLGRVQAFLPDNQALLLWYRHTGGKLYSLEVDGSQWVESRDALVPVSVAPAKGRPHAFRLLTSPRTVHKAVHDMGRDP